MIISLATQTHFLKFISIFFSIPACFSNSVCVLVSGGHRVIFQLCPLFSLPQHNQVPDPASYNFLISLKSVLNFLYLLPVPLIFSSSSHNFFLNTEIEYANLLLKY